MNTLGGIIKRLCTMKLDKEKWHAEYMQQICRDTRNGEDTTYLSATETHTIYWLEKKYLLGEAE